MMERHRSAEFVNRVANDPSVFPHICGPFSGEVDLTPLIENENCIALMGEHGGFVFLYCGDNVYDAHSIVLPSGRGPWALNAAKESLDWIFEYGANEVLMRVPRGNIAVRALVRCLKGKLKFHEKEGWWRGNEKIPADVFSVTAKDWKQCRS